MNRRLVVFLIIVSAALAILVTAAAVPSADQSREEKIARAGQAAPESISKKATIVDVDGTVLRKGSNGWTCLPATGPGSTHPSCNDEVWMRAMEAMSRKADFRTDRIGISYMLAGDDNVNNKDPYDTKQDPGEVWVQEGPHLMIIVPDPKMLEGISDDPDNGGPYLMWNGTPYTHVMVPVGSRTSGN